MRDKRLITLKTHNRAFILYRMDALFLYPTGWLLCSGKPLQRSVPSINIFMFIITLLFNVMERLFDELVKELALDRFVIFSGTVRRINGKVFRMRKGI